MISHLIELRTRLLRYMLILILAFVICFWQADVLFSWLSEPLRAALGPHTTMIFIAPHEAFFTYVRVAMFFGFFITFPWLLAELWGFIVPGLYDHERRLFTPLLLAGALLFYGGGLFAYLGVFPVAFKFFFGFASAQITAMPSLKESLTMFMRMLFAFGLAFELPMVLLLLMHFGVVTAETLKANRGYVVLIVFVAAAVLTPPDVITQIMLALPMWLLFELSLLCDGLLKKRGDAA
ncbi:MAG: twin-arginine translocase subunit TatC [Mariprofundales bacterium]|nr:twin-arginine translocase subunit TatC [Mariprofundales bacterium]